MPNVFISYSHVSPDQDLASQLAGVLEANGVTVFLDTKIRIGEEWVEQIDQQLRRSQYFVVLLSETSVQSDMVRREIALAYKLRKSKQLTVFPVRIDALRELPYDVGAYLDSIQYVAWKCNEPFEPVSRRILHAILLPENAATEVSNLRAVSPAQPVNANRFDPKELECVKDQLATFIGPMARMLVDRAAKQVTNWGELYEILATEVPAGKERKMFLSHRPR